MHNAKLTKKNHKLFYILTTNPKSAPWCLKWVPLFSMKNHHWKEMTPKVLAFVTILQVDRFLVSDLAAAAPSHKALSSKIAHNRYLDLFFEWILFFTPDFKDDHLLWTFHYHHHSGHICRINEWAHGGQGQVFQKSSCL